MSNDATEQTNANKAVTGNRARVQRYRAKNRRIDYVPSRDVMPIIEKHLAAGLNNCIAGVIDRLIREGHKAMSGNAISGSGQKG